MTDEIGIGPGHIGCGDDKPVAAAVDDHLFQPVGDLFRSADDGVLGLAAAREGDEIPRAWIGFATGPQHPVAMPIMPCMPPSSSAVSGSSMPLAAKSKFSPS